MSLRKYKMKSKRNNLQTSIFLGASTSFCSYSLIPFFPFLAWFVGMRKRFVPGGYIPTLETKHPASEKENKIKEVQ